MDIKPKPDTATSNRGQLQGLSGNCQNYRGGFGPQFAGLMDDLVMWVVCGTKKDGLVDEGSCYHSKHLRILLFYPGSAAVAGRHS